MFKKLLFVFYMPVLALLLLVGSTTFILTTDYENIKASTINITSGEIASLLATRGVGTNISFQDLKQICGGFATVPQEYKKYEAICDKVNSGEITSMNQVIHALTEKAMQDEVFSKIEEELNKASPLFLIIYLIALASYAIYLFFIYSVKKDSIVFYVAVAVVVLFILYVALGFIEEQISNAITSEAIKNSPPEIRIYTINVLSKINETVFSKLGEALLLTSILISTPLAVWALLRISLPTR